METAVRRRSWCAWLIVAVLLVLLLMPATGWVVASQLRGTFLAYPWVIPLLRAIGIKETVAPVYGSGDPADPIRRAAAGAPNDVGIQIAQAEWVDRPEGCMAAMRAVARRFPDSPEARAACLRVACRVELHFWRGDIAILDPPQPPHKPGDDPMPGGGSTELIPAPQAVDAFLADAAEGERLDPANAYFPLMRAVGLFAARRDGDGLGALHRAAALPRYDDYMLAALKGSTRLSERMPGWRGTLPRLGAMSSALFSHLGHLREAARIATALAVKEELAGRREAGLAIRRDAMRVGALVRTQSTALFASAAGGAMSRTALLRPGGAPAPAYDPDDDRDAKVGEALVGAYCAYLVRSGHEAEVPRVRGLMAGSRQVRQIARAWRDERSLRGVMLSLGAWSLACLFLLSNALWMLVLGGWAALAGRSKRIGEGRRLTWLGWVTAPFALALLGLGVFYQMQGGQGIAVFIVGVAYPVLECMDWSPGPWSLEFGAAAGFWPLLVLTLPISSALVFSAISLRSHVPLTVGLARGFRGMALPVACFLVVLYAGAAVATARCEARADAQITAYARHEGRYAAAKVGCQWPGEVAGEAPLSPTANELTVPGCH